nr:monooxygenase 1-like isoform X3 [Ziziphus jujuba var. spinosa]
MDADGIEIEEIDIVIVGAGICGLATALALHRKGIQSVVLERSETLRTSGIAIGILTNGWRALDQLGIGSKLRQTALPLQVVRDIWLDTHKQQASPLSTGEARCVKRSDLIQMLAEDLPIGTIRFGCRIVSLKLDPLTSYPILQLLDGRKVKAKVLIGCDGVNSVVAEFLKLKPKKLFPMCGVRGLTIYPNGHGRAPEFVRTHRNDIVCGRIPINENLLFWFLPFPLTDEIAKMVEDCETSYLSLTHLRYRTPWDVLLGRFRNGTVTVAGDAMHVMGPFLGQGGSAALEDAIVLARCLSQKIGVGGGDMERNGREIIQRKVGEAIDAYVEERRTRLVRLSAQTYLTGLLLGTTLKPLKLLILALIFLLFRDRIRHTRYDCGRL